MSNRDYQNDDSGESALNSANAAYLEELYQAYQENPDSIDPRWRGLFNDLGRFEAEPDPESPKVFDRFDASGYQSEPIWSPTEAQKQSYVLRLINAYRNKGHQKANLDPLNLTEPQSIPELDPAFHGLSDADGHQEFFTGSLAAAPRLKLVDLQALLEKVYCGPLGTEYMHIVETDQKRWIQNHLEQFHWAQFNKDEKIHLLQKLIAAEGLERYLHTKYVGQKRFSLEGGESLIPALDALIQKAGANGTKEIVIGMAHRGRLNVLVNTLGKAPADLFGEFEGTHRAGGTADSGDVKYHMGFSSDILTQGGPVHLALSFNPSHLEIINPVVEGSVRARQQRRMDKKRTTVLPLLIHGDAAFAGQGVVMETLQMSQARGYTTGGTIHLVVNNQIGFTTSHPMDARSTLYCTEVAKMVQAPIFHVNADDPEAVLFITNLALDFRTQFKKDVVIDLVCYRRHGHNEADEPSVTQPDMYKRIKQHATTRQIYADQLVAEGVLSDQQVEAMGLEFRDALDQGHVVAGQIIDPNKNKYMVNWDPYLGTEWTSPADTSMRLSLVRELAEKLEELPEGFELHPRVAKILSDRRRMAAGDIPMDWGFAENLAYAGLLEQGYSVRISGQDSGRGTFFHRHATLHDQQSGEVYVPLRHVARKEQFLVINSLLSEEAVLGFEYGYSTTDPETLVIWEAQFGDFANGAQVVIDQFISSGESKWGRVSGLTMLLPHGFEGQGPEHSSARLERYLQLSANHNIQVCIPSTPAQMFHMLRRQVLRPHRRPLIVLSPKSLLRHKMSTSPVAELEHGRFLTVITESDEHVNPAQVRQVVLCSGKVYYDLFQERKARQQQDVALVRIEQLQPFPEHDLGEILEKYPNAASVVWCQEEPRNQGAWYQINHHLIHCLREHQVLSYAGREASASPAVGYFKIHIQQQQALVEDALNVKTNDNQVSADRKVSHVY